jgi:hypothetical protein
VRAAAAIPVREMAGYTRGPHGVEAKHFRPKTRNEARRLVVEIFARQGPDGWDERSQATYMKMHGVEPRPVEELEVEELRILVDAMDKSHLVIFFAE